MRHLAVWTAMAVACCALAAEAGPAPASSCGPACTLCATTEPAQPKATAAAAANAIRFDFETGDLQGWKVFEGTFDKLLCDRDSFRNPEHRGRKWNKQGKHFINTTELAGGGFNDRMVGVIESPVFVLGGAEVSFLIGGGGHPDTRVALCTAEGDEILTARGKNSEVMRRVTWDAKDLVGRKVFVKIVDTHTGPWGHVTFDDLQAKGRIDPEATAERRASREALEAARRARAKTRAEELAAERAAGRARRMKELTDPKRLFARGQTRLYQDKHLGAISLPIGGVGSGSIQIDGRAVRHVWQVFNNMDQAFIPHSFFAIRAQTGDGTPIVRALQTAPVGPFPAMKALTFRGEYPFGWYDMADPALPVRVSLEVFSPLIPLDAKSSAAPCAIFRVTATNVSEQTVDVALLASQQNAVGYSTAALAGRKSTADAAINGRKFSRYGANRNAVRQAAGETILHLTSDRPKEDAAYGDMALAVVGDNVSSAASWDTLEKLAGDLAEDGTLAGPKAAGPSPAGETVDGALASRFTLEPKQKQTVTFVLTWHFPNGRHGAKAWGGTGNMYANWWPDACAVATWAVENLPELSRKTRLYHDSLYESNLPVYVLDRISSQAAVLVSQTCFWCENGYFGGWEGCCRGSGCCFGNCSHVWHYAQSHAHLLPEIGRRMREQELDHQRPDGGIPFRQGSNRVACDGTCGTVLGAYREHRLSPDGTWLKQNWPRIRKAMAFLIATWDQDEDGVLSGPQHNTLDGELGGSTTWLGGLYLASLAASEQMAVLQNEHELAKRYRTIRRAGMAKQNETLWNGEYYIQIPDANPLQDYRNGCAIDQMLGQWWAHQLDLGWLYPPDRVQRALQALLKHNLRVDFHGIPQRPRKFVDDDDAGMQMICWPKGDRPARHIRYADEVMSGFEYAAAGAMLQAGLLPETFTVIKAASDRYDGRLRTKLAGDIRGGRSAWGYSGNPFGDDECGKFYARPMSIWSVLTAGQGFIYDGPAGLIGFRPVWKPEDHRSFFTAAEGWGVFSQKRDGTRQTERIEVRCGRLKVASMVFAPGEQTEVSKVTVTAGKRELATTYRREGNRLTISLSRPVTAEAGSAITVVIE